MISQDLKTALCLTTVLECQNGEQSQKSKENFDGKCQDNQQSHRDTAVVENSDQRPVNLNTGSHTFDLYCDLARNETLGYTPTALLRSIPVETSSSTDKQ